MQFRNNNFEKILASFALALVNSAAAISSTDYPGDLCCNLYQNSNYEGAQLNLCLNTDRYGFNGLQQWILRDINLPNSNDNWENKVSSYWCGKNVAFDWCDRYYGDCSKETGVSGAGNVRNPKIGRNDKADRLRLRYYDAAERGAVMLFRDIDCEAAAGRFYSDSDPTLTALYTQNDMYFHNIKNDYPSSIMVPYGYSVKLWEDNGFKKSSKVFDGPEFLGEHERMQCINLTDKDVKFNDKTSSLEVYRTNYGRKARGYWHAITSSADSIFTYTKRVNYAKSPSKEAQNYYMNLDMHSGIDFVGFGGDETIISDEYAHEITTETNLQISQDTIRTRQVPCRFGYLQDGVGLWQFVVESGDANTSVMTDHTVCRYGDLYNVAPPCPWNACDNDDCSVCKGDWELDI